MPFSYVVAKEAVETYGKELINKAVGTGPFKLESFNGSSKIVWNRNPTYRKELYPSEGEQGDKEAGLLEDAGKPLPLVDRLIDNVFEEDQPLWLNFMAGKLDAGGIPKDNYAQAIGKDGNLTKELVNKGITLHKYARLDVVFTAFNMNDPLLGKNKYLRQALSLAYDDAKRIELLYNGRALPAQGPIPPGLAGYDPDFKNPYRQFNVEKAKELLAKAGYPEGKGLPPLEYMTTSGSTERQFREYDERQFAQIGVKLKVSTFSWPEFTAAVKNKKGHMHGMAWGADYPDAENFLQLFYGKNISPGPNGANYSNPEFDRLYEKALTMDDSPQRTALYKQMVRIVVEDCPWIFNAHRVGYGLKYPWLKNYKFSEVESVRPKYYRIDESLKK